MEELWKEIPKYEDLYKVSNLGRIKNKQNKILGISKNGYSRISLNNKGSKTLLIHRLVMLAFKPEEYFEGAEVNHKNGIKNDNRLENLEWCTRGENNKHAIRTGLRKKLILVGIENKNSKLKDTDINKIKELYKENKTQVEIAKIFNVNRMTIHRILNNKSWTHINN